MIWDDSKFLRQRDLAEAVEFMFEQPIVSFQATFLCSSDGYPFVVFDTPGCGQVETSRGPDARASGLRLQADQTKRLREAF